MKKYLTIPALFAAATLSVQATTVHNGLVNYWALDGNGDDTAGDFAGNTSSEANTAVVEIGTNEVATGGVSIESTGGLFGGAGAFERTDSTGAAGNTNGRLAVADSTDVQFGGGDLTISLWAQFDDNDTAWQTVISKGEGSEYRLGAQNNTDNVNYAGGLGDANGASDIQVSGQWFHILATTENGGNTQVFVDGVLIDTNTGTAGIVNDTTDLWIGNNPESAARQWDGLIDDVAQWDRVLTNDEITEIFAAGELGISLGQIPEPSSSLLLGLSGLMIAIRRRR